MKISDVCIKLVKHFEGCHLSAYTCPGKVLTIAYGATGKVDGVAIHEGMTITQEKAEEILRKDMLVFEKAVNKLVKVTLNQNQFDSLVSFAYNCGEQALKSSTLLKLLNSGDYQSVPGQLARWNKADGKVLAGLVRRRRSEGILFSTGKLVFSDK